MQMKSFIAALAASTALAGAAHAQENLTVGGGYTHYSFDGDISAGSIFGRVGADFYDGGNFTLGGEGELSYGILGDEEGGVDFDLGFGVAAFGKVTFPLPDAPVEFHGRLGLAYLRATIEGEGFDETEGETEFAFGGGAKFHFNEQSGIRADIMFADETTAFQIAYEHKLN